MLRLGQPELCISKQPLIGLSHGLPLNHGTRRVLFPACAASIFFALWLLPRLALQAGGLPEPDLVLYGSIRNVGGGLETRLTVGRLTWTFKPAGGGASFAVTAVLTNINDQFSYVLRVPCEGRIAGTGAADGTLALGSVVDRAQVTVDGQPASFVDSSQGTLNLGATDRGRIERVDLRVSIAGGGGLLPDNWQIQYFGRTGIDPFADPDGDGLDNLGEYRAGTHPSDPASRFAIDVVDRAPGGPQLTWSSVAGVVYTVQRSKDLFTGFQDLALDIPATPPRNQFRDPVPVLSGPYFYRLLARRTSP